MMHKIIMGLGGATAALGVFFWVMAVVTTALGTLSAPIVQPIAAGGGLVLAGAAVYALGAILGKREA
ncbi:MAG: hypothetical protein JNK47_02795 [Mesorhizobium sp.]|nr:hypothetical protein [Mesorhizobium sp.]MBL8576128.1 hypothetical protein [Mesorhizobium sp.]